MLKDTSVDPVPRCPGGWEGDGIEGWESLSEYVSGMDRDWYRRLPMIVVEERSTDEAGHVRGYRCITQPDHARLAGELMALWRTDGLPDHPRREEILLAIREHDNGWRETDAAPHLDRERRRPHDFVSLPLPERLAVWPRAVGRYAERCPYAALLIAHHALALYGDHRGEEDFEELFEVVEPQHEWLLEVTGLDEKEVEQDYAFLAFADRASLAVCNRWPEGFSRQMPDGTVEGRFDPGTSEGEAETLHLDPFPLAGRTSFRVPYRYLPAREYTGDADLAVELATARWREARVRVSG